MLKKVEDYCKTAKTEIQDKINELKEAIQKHNFTAEKTDKYTRVFTDEELKDRIFDELCDIEYELNQLKEKHIDNITQQMREDIEQTIYTTFKTLDTEFDYHLYPKYEDILDIEALCDQVAEYLDHMFPTIYIQTEWENDNKVNVLF